MPLSVPYTKSMRGRLSYRRISKFTDIAGAELYTALHSTLKTLLGAIPDTEVKIPQPLVNAEHPGCELVMRSSHNGTIALAKFPLGRQELAPPIIDDPNCKLPLEERLALLKVLS